VIVKADGVSLLESSAPTTDLSDELRTYPQNLLQSPPTVSSASFKFTTLAQSVATLNFKPDAQTTGVTSIAGRSNDRFAELIAIPDLGFGAIVLALLGALIWGAAHAFSPGHGKTIVAAYLVGSRATVKHALFLGLTTTITHTSGVFALGLITLFASQSIVPEQLFPWLEAISGGLVIAIGGSLFVNRLRKLRRADTHDQHHHDHDHDHAHDHNHGHDHEHQHHDHRHSSLVTRHSHLPPSADGAPVSWRSLLALGISGGLLPCPSALVVMLGAIALNRVGFGLLLILVFSAGLAGMLTAIGLVMVRAKDLIERLSSGGKLFGRIPINRRLIQVLPAVSALFIVLAGFGITLTALAGLN
jgi:ABC-type nickel/cobalt efflux system permease component RcnA